MKIDIQNFKGSTPKVDRKLLPDGYATVAQNCRTDSGSLVPYNGTSFIVTPGKAGVKKTIFKYNDFWLHWTTVVDVIRGPIAGDTSDRVYWTGDGLPKVSDASIITAGGGTQYPTNSYTLGVPAPTTAPFVSVSGASSDPTQAESRAYVYTFVNSYGDEGPPGPVSSIVSPEPAQTVDLAGMETAPSGAYNITQKRIYRTSTGSTGTEYKFVATIAIANTTYNDSISSSIVGLNETLPSTYWDAPPSDMHSLVLHPSGFAAGISGKDICFSVPYIPHAWPVGYRIPIEEQPIGLGVFGNTVLVLPTSKPYAITGTDPQYLSKERMELNQACVSKRGIVDMGEAVAYPGPDGLMVIGSGVAKNITQDIYTKKQWSALLPDSMIGSYHDGKYYGFSNGSGIIVDFSSSDTKTITVNPTAVYVIPDNDLLCLQIADDIISWDSDNENIYADLTWSSKQFSFPSPVSPPGAAMVVAGG